MNTFPANVKIGDFVNGVTVTEVRSKKVFGVEGHLDRSMVEQLKKYFAQPTKDRGFMFRPGQQVGETA